KFERLRAEHHARVVHEVLEALDAATITAVALKGSVLGERLYGTGSPRPCTDVDLLFCPRDLSRAVTALERIGYRAEEDPLRAAERAHAHPLELHRPGSPAVEAHFRLHSEFGAEVPAEPFLERSLAYRTRSGAMTRVLAPEDELLHLALHA